MCIGKDTSGSFTGWSDVLGLVEGRKTVVRDLEHPARVDDAVPGRQVAVDPGGARMQVPHPLHTHK